LIEVRHDHLRIRNLTGYKTRLPPLIRKLWINRLKIVINLPITLGNQIQYLALHFPIFILDFSLVWRNVVLDYFGEGLLIALEFYDTNDILQAADHLFVLSLLSEIGCVFFQRIWCHKYPLGGHMNGFEQV
jgi:hypothetical protein